MRHKCYAGPKALVYLISKISLHLPPSHVELREEKESGVIKK